MNAEPLDCDVDMGGDIGGDIGGVLGVTDQRRGNTDPNVDDPTELCSTRGDDCASDAVSIVEDDGYGCMTRGSSGMFCSGVGLMGLPASENEEGDRTTVTDSPFLPFSRTDEFSDDAKVGDAGTDWGFFHNRWTPVFSKILTNITNTATDHITAMITAMTVRGIGATASPSINAINKPAETSLVIAKYVESTSPPLV